jgi:SagB-type dehydrogenase family enzyme
MRKLIIAVLVILCVAAGGIFGSAAGREQTMRGSREKIELPEPETGTGLPAVLDTRHSVRDFADRPLTLEQAGQLLWACAGVTDGMTRATRVYPSAGGIHPLEAYMVAGNVLDLEPGVYLYDPGEHSLSLVRGSDLRRDLAQAALGQVFIARAPASIVVAGNIRKTARRYGNRAGRYVHMEAGHAAQNVYLQAGAMDLGTVAVGAFVDDRVGQVLGLEDQSPLYILPVGVPR